MGRKERGFGKEKKEGDGTEKNQKMLKMLVIVREQVLIVEKGEVWGGKGEGSLKFIFGGRKQALSPQWMDSARFSNITVFKSSTVYKHNILYGVHCITHPV
jgi:hypothetical protein